MAEVTLADLRCRIEIKRRVETPDDIGGSTSTWETVATAWAKIEAASARDNYRADRSEALVTQKVTVRAGTNVSADDVIVFDGRSSTIKALRPVTYGKSKYLELLCVDGDPSGGNPL